MALTDYSTDTLDTFAELVVDFGFSVTDAADTVGIDTDDVQPLTKVAMDLLRKARFNRWRKDIWPVIKFITIYANANRDTNKKPTPFTEADFMPLTREEHEERQRQMEKEAMEMALSIAGSYDNLNPGE